MYFICVNCSIREYQSDLSPLYWHNRFTYYALNSAGIFDRGLPAFQNLFTYGLLDAWYKSVTSSISHECFTCMCHMH